MNISDKIKYIGVDDTTLDLFESQYAVPEGVSYNSYVILDDKTAIMDTVDKRGMKDWENNLLNTLDGKNADYVIVQHMEPDHAGSLARLIELFPEITVVGNAKTFVMINQFFENIVGKYGAPVQTLLKKASALDIKTICPLHGPVLSDNLGYYLDLYNTWSSYQPESKGVFIAYASIHGNTAYAAEQFAEMLLQLQKQCETYLRQ